MDQIAAMGLQALQAYKEQLDKAKEAVEVARVLARKIEIFEVTIGMIPNRGNKEDVEKINNSVPEKKEAEKEKRKETIISGAVNYATDQAKGMIMDQVNSFIDASPFGIVKDLLLFDGGDKIPITNNMRPAEILAAMRENGSNDLDVSFVAMRFIIHSALKIIAEAVSDVTDIEIPDFFWLCMPWKVAKQNETAEKLNGHFEAIDKFNIQLQSAISVASYCVSLEQLENVLNATNIFSSLRIREFWKRKVGIQNTRVRMIELAESFMSEVQDALVEYKKTSRHYPEKILKNRGNVEVALNRFLSFLWNGNGDEWATVYEIHAATEPFVKLY